MTTITTDPDTLIGPSEAVALLGLTWRTWERLRRLPSFPRPWGGYTHLWRQADLQAFVGHSRVQMGRLSR